MLTTAVRSRAVSLPLQPVPYLVERAGTKREWGKTRLTPHRPKPSLQYVIDTDDGITGVGEACTDIGFFGEPVEEVQSAIDLYPGPKLLGKDPFDREQLLFDIDFPGNSCAKSGIDLALHDLLGKALDVPVCNLIGGSGRRQVLAVMEVAAGTPDGMARQCAEWVEQGVRGFKAKVGAIPEQDVERLAAIRAAVSPEIMLRADTNQGYTPKEAPTKSPSATDDRTGQAPDIEASLHPRRAYAARSTGSSASSRSNAPPASNGSATTSTAASPTTPVPPWRRSGQAPDHCGTRGSASRPHARLRLVVVATTRSRFARRSSAVRLRDASAEQQRSAAHSVAGDCGGDEQRLAAAAVQRASLCVGDDGIPMQQQQQQNLRAIDCRREEFGVARKAVERHRRKLQV